jgi:hypothetical protein
LALSLGYRATVTSKRARLNGRDCGEVYRVRFTTDDDVFRLERKRKTLRQRSNRHNPERTRYRYITDVRPVASRPVRCIAVDSPSHLYLAGREIVPTHNTMFQQLLLYQAFVMGARIVDIDPKGDHRFHVVPEVSERAQVIVLGPQPEHAGKLDPLRVAPPNERHDATSTFLIDVLPPVDAKIQSAINGAISRVIERHAERACCMEVIAELERGERPEEREAGYLLRQYCEAGLVRLGFAKLDDPLPAQASEQVTYLQIRALKRAHTDTVRSEMSQGQRHGRAVLQLVALYAMRILGEERDRLKILSFDEASFLSQDAVGQQLLDTLARYGRSELAVPILSTQLIGDVEKQDNLVGHWFLFGMRSREHAARRLELLDIDSDDQRLLENLTERYGKGRALYRDLQGRCEEVKVDIADPRLFELLNTTPVEEETVADDGDDDDELAA